MSLSTSKITELAPDQESLHAANKLTKSGKWPSLSKWNQLVWGECQGSGSIPYRTVFDNSNLSYKCTCPSRKFPCKHVLALMWMYVMDPSPFADGEVPIWVTDWLGRRKNPATNSNPNAKPPKAQSEIKSLPKETFSPEAQQPLAPEVEARRKAMADKRARATQESIAAGIEELEQWIRDQLRSGLTKFLSDPSSTCRTIAARLVDAKAQAMASRLDELPARLMQSPFESRLNALLTELSRIVLICRAWKSAPKDAELNRLIGSSETRDEVLEQPDGLRVRSIWRVVGEQVTTRRDGLVSQATWLINLGQGTRFALLLDFFPASLGKRSSVFAIGEQFESEIAFYPAREPLRGILANRKPSNGSLISFVENWPAASNKPLESYRETLQRSPWIVEVPLLLPAGRMAQVGSRFWWQAEDKSLSLPVINKPARHFAGLEMKQTVALWDGISLTLLSGDSNWGSLSYEN